MKLTLVLAGLLFSTLASAATTRITLGVGGVEANGASYVEDVTPDGRYVVFSSFASNLVANDTNNERDVFVYDVLAESIELVSQNSSGVLANGASTEGSISDDGRFVCFTSDATNLVSGDSNAVKDVFRRDLLNGLTTRVSLGASAAQGNGASGKGRISGSGFVVAFESTATNLVASDTNGVKDVFVRDLNTSVTSRVSVDAGGSQVTGESGSPSLSEDGTIVAFEASSALVGGDTNGDTDVYVWDLGVSTLSRASVGAAGAQAAGFSYLPGLSADGNLVVFSSRSTTFGPATEQTRIYLKNLTTGALEHVSLTNSGLDGNGDSEGATISADGRYVSFTSLATNLVRGDTNGVDDVFVRDRTNATTGRVSVTSAGGQSASSQFTYFSNLAPVTNDGTVAFASTAADLVAGDTVNGFQDVFTGKALGRNVALIAQYEAEIKKLQKQIKAAKKKKKVTIVKKLTKKLKQTQALLAGL
jgi:Tol biopolymer transport system component